MKIISCRFRIYYSGKFPNVFKNSLRINQLNDPKQKQTIFQKKKKKEKLVQIEFHILIK